MRSKKQDKVEKKVEFPDVVSDQPPSTDSFNPETFTTNKGATPRLPTKK